MKYFISLFVVLFAVSQASAQHETTLPEGLPVVEPDLGEQVENGTYVCAGTIILVRDNDVAVDPDMVARNSSQSHWRNLDGDTKFKLVRRSKSILIAVENDLHETYSIVLLSLKKQAGQYSLDMANVSSADYGAQKTEAVKNNIKCVKQ